MSDPPAAIVRRPPWVVIVLVAAGGLAAAVGGLALTLPALGVPWPLPAAARLLGLAALLVGVLFGTAGLGVVVFGPVFAGPAAAALDFGSHRVVLSVTAFATLTAALIGSLISLAVFGLTGQRNPNNVLGFLAPAASVSLVLLAVAYLRFLRPGVVSLADFGFARNRLASRFADRAWLAHLMTGLGGGVLVMALSAGVQAAMGKWGVEQTQLLDFTWVRELSPPQFAVVWLVGAVLGPISEEVFFRGIVFRGYLQTKGPLTAYLVSSVVFALLHLNPPAFPPILVLGLVLAWLYRSTQSLMPCMLAHGFNNGVAFLVLRFGPDGLM